MNTQVISLFLLAFVSGTGMGISQKFLAGYSPWLVNGIAAVVVAVIALSVRFFNEKNIANDVPFHRAMVGLGLSYLCLNISYSMLYGQNIPVTYVPIIVTGVMTVTLGLAGYFFFGETITWRFIIGAMMILVGMGVMVGR